MHPKPAGELLGEGTYEDEDEEGKEEGGCSWL
jgi:hypothetical protein